MLLAVASAMGQLPSRRGVAGVAMPSLLASSAGLRKQHITSHRRQCRTSCSPPPPLASTAGRRGKQSKQNPHLQEGGTSFIGGGPGRVPPHHLRLRPPKHRDKENHHQRGLDPARRIHSPPPGMKPKTSTQPKLTNTTSIETTIYSPRSGASPSPSPASYSGGRDIRSARPTPVDSQREETSRFERGEEKKTNYALQAKSKEEFIRMKVLFGDLFSIMLQSQGLCLEDKISPSMLLLEYDCCKGSGSTVNNLTYNNLFEEILYKTGTQPHKNAHTFQSTIEGIPPTCLA